MATVKEYQTHWQFSDWNSPDSDHMSLFQLVKSYSYTCANPMFTANVGFPGYPVSDSDLIGLNSEQPDAVGGLLKRPQSISRIPFTGEFQGSMLHGQEVPTSTTDASFPQKRFLIFDQSGSDTRLFISPSFSKRNQDVVSNSPALANDSCKKLVDRVDKHFSVHPIEEKWGENHLTDEEDEMLEDSEEIDALLFSESDEEDDADDTCAENDDAVSTGHTPFLSEKAYNRKRLFEELTEEVASSDGFTKRQKLLDGSYKKSSLMTAGSSKEPTRSHCHEDDIDLNAREGNSSDDVASSKREKIVKIREAVKILESIIPRSKTKDPLSTIDKAIVYLKHLKLEAESLGRAALAASQPPLLSFS